MNEEQGHGIGGHLEDQEAEMQYNVCGGCEIDYDAVVQLIQAIDLSCAVYRHVWLAAG